MVSYAYPCLLFLLCILVYSRLHNTIVGEQYQCISLNVSYEAISKHVENIIHIGDSNLAYEESRARSREYIRDGLSSGGIPQDQILWHYFEWKEMRGAHNNLTTYTWRGINIIVWLNRTEMRSEKVRIFGAHYDTYFWGVNSTAGANNNLAGTALLMELATSLYRYQQQRLSLDVEYKEIPYLFVFFDHSESGAIGSKTFVEHFQMEEKANQIGCFVNIDGVGYKGSAPFLQTYPYEHNLQTYYSPHWLISLFVRASYQSGVSLNVGNPRKARSLLFQAYRYHLLSVPYGGDDGPFAWRGIPTAFLTDYDYFFEGNPHQRQVTDQLLTLGKHQVEAFVKVLESFISVSQNFPGLKNSDFPGAYSIFNSLRFFIPGIDQYLQVGHVVFGFWDLASISLAMIIIVYYTSVQHYRTVSPKDQSVDNVSSESESGDADNEGDVDTQISPVSERLGFSYGYVPKKWKSYKILVIHLALMGVAVVIDTVFAFQMLLLGMLALTTIYVDVLYINVNTGFLCGVLCANFLYKDFRLMCKFGLRSGDARELKLIMLLIIYVLHTFLLIVYGYDYRRKKARQDNAAHLKVD